MASMNFDYEILDSCKCEPSKKYPLALPNINKLLEEESEVEPKKCRYGPKVLVSNWYERRATYVPEPDDWVTVHDTTYTCKTNVDIKKDRSAFEDNQRKAHGLGGKYLINSPAEAFTKNYTTTNDLYFRVFPLDLCGPRIRKYSSRKDQWVPVIDLSKEYGNLTAFGLTEAVECETYLSLRPSPRESIHKRDFRCPTRYASYADTVSTKRYPRSKGDTNEPHLEHLDIDPNKPFRPHIIRSKICKT